MASPSLADRVPAKRSEASFFDALALHPGLSRNPVRSALIQSCLTAKEAIITRTGALATWGRKGETGRIPKDTYIVRRPSVEVHVDWTSPTCIPMEPAVFEKLLSDAVSVLRSRKRIIMLDRSVGAEEGSALALHIITDSPLAALFSDTMFRAALKETQRTVLGAEPFTLIVLPKDKIATDRYRGVLREEKGRTVDMCIAMDYEKRIGLVYGTGYCGAVKKTIFTAMNYLLPEKRILPLHCAASADKDGSVALFLGLSGTGKTTLSAIPGRTLLGDDEHLWSDSGIANLEGGCYAKLIKLRREKEPKIFDAVFSERPAEENGVIIENAMVFPDGSYDLDDDRLTENSRASFPLSFLSDADPRGLGAHPSTILFLTADAEGVLPPIAYLTPEEAERWFFLGYTSKLGGTEAGVVAPQPNFSRFFGGPFMPRQPKDYRKLFRSKISEHRCDVYLVNTGWTGGPYGTGQRMEIAVSRAVVDAALSGSLRRAEMRKDPHFGFSVPMHCAGIDDRLLDPKKTWKDVTAYERAAQKLAEKIDGYLQKAA